MAYSIGSRRYINLDELINNSQFEGHAMSNDLLKVLKEARDYIVEDSLYFQPPEDLIPRIDALLAQGTEQPTSNRQVEGSNPSERASYEA